MTTTIVTQGKDEAAPGRSRFIEALEESLGNGSTDFVKFIAEQTGPSTERNRRRREAFFNTQFSICVERARYFTESFSQTEGEPAVIRMANSSENSHDFVT